MILAIIVFLPIFAGILMWKNYNYFLSRRDHYRNSDFDILGKRITMSVQVVVFTFLGLLFLLDCLLKK